VTNLIALIFLAMLLACPPVFGQESGQQPPSATNETPAHEQQVVRSGSDTHVHLGTVFVGFAYRQFAPPFFVSPFGYWCGPWGLNFPCGDYTSPYYPNYFTNYPKRADKGALKLKIDPPHAQVFLDGGYAGTADRLKNIPLQTGVHDLLITAEHRAPFRQRLYILTGRTLRVSSMLEPQRAEDKP
jgi:hypothetical protein